jgi:predicted nucleotidyltransferase
VSAIEEIVRQLLSPRPEVDAVVLYGSAAAGRQGPASDLDLYVRLRPMARWSIAERLDRAADLSTALRREVDLVVEDEWTSVILRREVANRGRPIYEARAGAWVDLRAAAAVAYADLEPYLRRIGEAVRARARAHG